MPRFDLLALVADLDTETALDALLRRPEALGIRPISFRIYRHPERDPGCFVHGPEFMRSFLQAADRALILLDRHGSGRDARDRADLEGDLEARLAARGWHDRSAAVVLEPELESWVWSDSPEVDRVLGWRQRDLRTWLEERDYLVQGVKKPADPKAAVEAALREARKPRSPALYAALASKVSLRRCADPAFVKMVEVLGNWFSAHRQQT